MKTKLTELLGIKYPVIQGGMAWTSDAVLAAAVSNAGGAFQQLAKFISRRLLRKCRRRRRSSMAYSLYVEAA